jgi:Holliday junction resolvase
MPKRTKKQLGKLSKEKGKRGERAVAQLLKNRGYEAKRGVQYQGGPESPDVVSELEKIHIEVKRTEALSLYVAMAQAELDAGPEQVPTVWHRRSKQEWLVVLKAEDFLDMLVELYPPEILDILR